MEKKKARQLVKKFHKHSLYVPLDNAKKCAVICVDEIIKTDSLFSNLSIIKIKDRADREMKDTCKLSYWEKVKLEIIKIKEL